MDFGTDCAAIPGRARTRYVGRVTRAYVRFRRGDGDERDLGHGDVIGRLWSAALPIDDPRVSEAHAMVSLRGSRLKLLALRGRFAVAEVPLTELELAVGQRIELAQGLAIEVLEVELPEVVMALEGPGLLRQVLPAVSSLRIGARVALEAGFHPDAHAVVWSDGRAWRMRRLDEASAGTSFEAGDTLTIGDRTFVASSVPLDLVGQPITTAQGGIDEPLHLVVRYDTAHVFRGGQTLVVLDGMGARILGELVAIGVPAPWEVIARELWPDEIDAYGLRKRWDVALWRMRRKLREGRIRPDLIRPDGSGNVELCLARGDTLDNQL